MGSDAYFSLKEQLWWQQFSVFWYICCYRSVQLRHVTLPFSISARPSGDKKKPFPRPWAYRPLMSTVHRSSMNERRCLGTFSLSVQSVGRLFRGVANLLIRGCINKSRFCRCYRLALNITSVFILYLCRLRRGWRR